MLNGAQCAAAQWRERQASASRPIQPRRLHLTRSHYCIRVTVGKAESTTAHTYGLLGCYKTDSGPSIVSFTASEVARKENETVARDATIARDMRAERAARWSASPDSVSEVATTIALRCATEIEVDATWREHHALVASYKSFEPGVTSVESMDAAALLLATFAEAPLDAGYSIRPAEVE